MADDNDMGDLLDYELSGFYHHMGVISWVGLIVALLVICLNLFIIIMSFYKNPYVIIDDGHDFIDCVVGFGGIYHQTSDE